MSLVTMVEMRNTLVSLEFTGAFFTSDYAKDCRDSPDFGFPGHISNLQEFNPGSAIESEVFSTLGAATISGLNIGGLQTLSTC